MSFATMMQMPWGKGSNKVALHVGAVKFFNVIKQKGSPEELPFYVTPEGLEPSTH